jgi:hypothetical protein
VAHFPGSWPSSFFKGECDSFLQVLNLSGITLSNAPDTLAWIWNKENGTVTVKEAYKALTYLSVVEDCKWWYSIIWKIQAPSKITLFMWLCLENKVLIGENFRKRGGIGPSACPLCLNNEEST